MKNLLLTGIGVFISAISFAQEGPLSATDFTTISIPGSVAGWNNFSNAAGSDDYYSTPGNISNPTGSYTDYLVGNTFRFAVPEGVIIRGIVVEIESSDPTGLTGDYSIRLTRNGILGTTDRAIATPYSATDNYRVYGSATDLWGETWTSKEINQLDFGVAIAVKRTSNGGNTGAQIDDIRVTVYYDFFTLPVNLLSFSATKKDKVVDLTWTTSGESMMDHYEIGRSDDGRNFQSIGSKAGRNSTANTQYTITDNAPASRVAYYRLKMVGVNGEISYSKIISIQWSTGRTIALYPNPILQGETLHISNPNKESLTVRFFNITGKSVAQVNTQSGELDINWLKGQKGIFVYRVVDSKNICLDMGQLVVK
jgi:hypothetical protein